MQYTQHKCQRDEWKAIPRPLQILRQAWQWGQAGEQIHECRETGHGGQVRGETQWEVWGEAGTSDGQTKTAHGVVGPSGTSDSFQLQIERRHRGATDPLPAGVAAQSEVCHLAFNVLTILQ